MDNNVIEARNLSKKYKKSTVIAVNGMNLNIRKGELFGLVGPDGAGKTTTVQMLCGILNPTLGGAKVLGLDIVKDAEKIRGKIGYMSEGFSLFGALTVNENIEFFADLYKVPHEQREKRKQELLHFSRLTKFVDRPSEKLSGGMKKKLALCCTLIYSPEILFLDEPTLGVDPVSRREFWKILHDFRQEGITIFVTTPYMDEAERCDRVALLHKGEVIRLDAPANLRRELTKGQDLRSGTPSLEDVFVSAINEKLAEAGEIREIKSKLNVMEREKDIRRQEEIAISIENLTIKFGDFIAVDNLSISVKQGEIFGFLGPNGSGKSTTIKTLTGLLMPTGGNARVGGFDVVREIGKLKSRIGYMSQRFSLYDDLTVEENIDFYGGVYDVGGERLKERKKWVLAMAGLSGKENSLAKSLSGGWKQRLALGCAILHEPSILFLDEPTSGVDPIARRYFWDLIYELSEQGVTVFVTTHYMDEAEHCHKLGFIYNGSLIALGSPQNLKKDIIKGELLELECNDPFTAIEVLGGEPYNYRVSTFGSKIHVLVDNIAQAEADISTLLTEHHFHIERMDPVPLSLEDLFVHLIEEDDKKNIGLE